MTRSLANALLVIALAFGPGHAYAQSPDVSAQLQAARTAVDAKNYVAAQELLQAALKKAPDNQAARFLLARVLAWSSAFGKAIEQYQTLLGMSPGNADYLLGLGQTRVWNGQPEQALAPLRKARTLAPDYLDVWRVELTALRAIDTEDSKAQATLLRQAAATRFTEAQLATLPQEAAVATPAQSWTEFGAGGGAERLSNGRDPWYSAQIDVSHRFESGHSLYGFAQVEERFRQQDETLGADVYVPIGEDWLVQLEGAVGNNNQVLPKWALFGRVDFEVTKGFLIGAAYKRSQYLVPTVDIATFAVQKYWSNFRAGLAINASSVERAHPVYSRTAELDYYYGERSFIGISGSTGSEAEFINASRIVNRHTRSVVVRGRHWVWKDAALEYALNRSDVGDIFRRYGIRLGIRWRY